MIEEHRAESHAPYLLKCLLLKTLSHAVKLFNNVKVSIGIDYFLSVLFSQLSLTHGKRGIHILQPATIAIVCPMVDLAHTSFLLLPMRFTKVSIAQQTCL
jgi:hypothetical protein